MACLYLAESHRPVEGRPVKAPRQNLVSTDCFTGRYPSVHQIKFTVARNTSSRLLTHPIKLGRTDEKSAS
jgi:hypothetical protein